jgi:hypothetical protein
VGVPNADTNPASANANAFSDICTGCGCKYGHNPTQSDWLSPGPLGCGLVLWSKKQQLGIHEKGAVPGKIEEVEMLLHIYYDDIPP